MLRRLSLAFAAGTVGALTASLALWLSGRYGLTARVHVSLAPALSLYWLYPRLVIGGLWGALLLVPFSSRPHWRALSMALVPSMVQLLWVYPLNTGHGWLGIGLGMLTPLVIYAHWLVWSIAALLWSRATGSY